MSKQGIEVVFSLGPSITLMYQVLSAFLYALLARHSDQDVQDRTVPTHKNAIYAHNNVQYRWLQNMSMTVKRMKMVNFSGYVGQFT